MLRIDTFQDWSRIEAELADWPLELEVLCSMPLSRAADRTDIASKPGHETPFQAVIRSQDVAIGAIAQSSDEVTVAIGPGAPVDETAHLLAADFDARFDTLPRLFGSTQLVEKAAQLLAERRGVSVEPGMSDRFYQLHEPIAPARQASGSARLATGEDLEPVAAWIEAFVRDAELPALDGRDLGTYLIAKDAVFLWLDGGEPVSMAAIGGQTPRCARIGFVYTPDSLRSRGYAAAITDVTTRRALDAGRVTCCLLADTHNPLTNRLYQRLGYRHIGDAIDIGFSQ